MLPKTLDSTGSQLICLSDREETEYGSRVGTPEEYELPFKHKDKKWRRTSVLSTFKSTSSECKPKTDCLVLNRFEQFNI